MPAAHLPKWFALAVDHIPRLKHAGAHTSVLATPRSHTAHKGGGFGGIAEAAAEGKKAIGIVGNEWGLREGDGRSLALRGSGLDAAC